MSKEVLLREILITLRQVSRISQGHCQLEIARVDRKISGLFMEVAKLGDLELMSRIEALLHGWERALARQADVDNIALRQTNSRRLTIVSKGISTMEGLETLLLKKAG
jgi:hypothetical protein